MAIDRAKRDPDEPTPKRRGRPEPEPLLDGTEEDDGQPYRVPGDPEDQKESCPECLELIPLGALVCNHCGFNRETGAKLQRVYKKVAQSWDTGLRLPLRLGIYLGVQGIVLVATLILAVAGGSWGGLVHSWVVGAVMLAFLLGTFPRIHLERSKKGQVRLTKTWRICFIPLGPSEIRWREFEGVSAEMAHKTNFMDWFLFLVLLPCGVIPGILWWFWVLEPDEFDVALTRDHGGPAELLYRGRSEATALEVATTVRKTTGLP